MNTDAQTSLAQPSNQISPLHVKNVNTSVQIVVVVVVGGGGGGKP